MSKLHEELIKLSFKKNSKNGQRTSLDIFKRHRDDQQTYKKMLNISNHQGNATENHMRYHLMPIRMLTIKLIQIANLGEDMDKRESSYTVGGNVNWCSYCGKQYGGF